MSGELNLQSLSFVAQAHVYKMEFVARIITKITQVCIYKIKYCAFIFYTSILGEKERWSNLISITRRSNSMLY